MDTDLDVRFARLFAGRGDAWGAVEGRSVKEKITLNLFQEHLFGEGSVGIYPLLDDGTVHWGCVDVDEGYDLIAIAINVWRALKHLGITAWVERTKGKGFHVWTLCSDWVPAEDMVAAQRVACALADYRPKEVNPKQTSLAPGQIGNYVNLCYAKRWVDEGRRVIIDAEDRSPIPLTMFLHVAEQSLNVPAVIAKAAALYVPPPPPKAVAIVKPAVDPGPRLRGIAKRLYEEGPLPNRNTGRIDRSAALQRLAHLLRADGFDPGEAYHLVADLDSRLGKYAGRADAELQYQRIIERAYG